MTPPAPQLTPDYCPVASKVAVLENEKEHLEKTMNKMGSRIEEIGQAVNRIELQSIAIKTSLDNQGKDIQRIDGILEAKNAQPGTGPGNGNGKTLEGVRAAIGGLAGSLGYSLLFGLFAGAMSPDMAKELVKMALKAFSGL